MDSPGSDERYSDYFQLDVDQENVDANALHGLHRYQHHQHHQHPHKRHQQQEEQRQRNYHESLPSCRHQDEEFPPCAYMYTSYSDNRCHRRDDAFGTQVHPSCESGDPEFRLPDHRLCMRLSDQQVSEARVSDHASSVRMPEQQAVVLSDQPSTAGLSDHPSSVRLSDQPSSFRLSDHPPGLGLSDQSSNFRLSDQSDQPSSIRLSDQPSSFRLPDQPSASILSTQSSSGMSAVSVTSYSNGGNCLHREVVSCDQSYSYNSHHGLRQYGRVPHSVGPLQVADMGNNQVRQIKHLDLQWLTHLY